MTDERRGSPRLEAHLAGEIETPEGKSSIAISRDVAAGGLLLFARSRLAAGTQVKLRMMFKGAPLELTCSVLRCEELDPGASTLWRTRIAVSVEPGSPLSDVYAALASESAEAS